ncbi:Bap-like protein [Corchorus olitorius]|uniref:Bap-like protein n=1 Tax=Corchorus olitorius TaxID=93759 RepID=A0A1R3GHX9_9ROSI|nr:Bap-like protein [Corchorus olitorius]
MGSSRSSSNGSLLLHRDPFIASLADEFTSNNPHFIYLLKLADLEKEAPLDGDEVESGSHWSYPTEEEGSHLTASTVDEGSHLTAAWFEEEDLPSTDMTVSFADCKSATVDHTVVLQLLNNPVVE